MTVSWTLYSEMSSDSYSTAESSRRGSSSRDVLPLLSVHRRAASWQIPWLKAAVESLNVMGGRGNAAPAPSITPATQDAGATGAAPSRSEVPLT